MRRLLAIEGLQVDQIEIFSRMPGYAVTLHGLRDSFPLDPLQLLVHCLPHELGQRAVPPGIDQWLNPLDLRRFRVDHGFSFRGSHDSVH
jgi:hypothetical protein